LSANSTERSAAFRFHHIQTQGFYFKMSNNNDIRVDVYGTDAPDAAKFGKGATTLAEVKQATQARVDLSKNQSTGREGGRH
jgi:hypothetical protein